MSRKKDSERCFEKLMAGTVTEITVYDDGVVVIFVDCPDGIRRDVYFEEYELCEEEIPVLEWPGVTPPDKRLPEHPLPRV